MLEFVVNQIISQILIACASSEDMNLEKKLLNKILLFVKYLQLLLMACLSKTWIQKVVLHMRPKKIGFCQIISVRGEISAYTIKYKIFVKEIGFFFIL